MMHKKRIVSLTLAFCLFIVAGCAGGGGAATPTTAKSEPATTAKATQAETTKATEATSAAPETTTAAPKAEAATTTAKPTTTTAATTAAPEPAANEKLLEKPITIDLWIVENASYVYQKGLLLERALTERTNISFNVSSFADGYIERINLGLASGDLPDVFFGAGVGNVSDWGAAQGALVNFADHFGEMPNYTAWAAEMGEYPYNFYTADGGLYIVPNFGYGTASNSTLWIHRKDIFEKHGINTPKTSDDVYDLCKQLKEIYPESYPMSCRGWGNWGGEGILDRIGYQFGTSSGMYFKNAIKQWTYARLEPEFKEMIEWLAKMYAEELLPPNILSMDTAGWQEIVSTSRGFMFNDYQARIDFYNKPMRAEDPSVTFAYMPPFKGGSNGVAKFNPISHLIISGACVFVTSKYTNELVKYFDWWFTPEAKELMSWGIAGESFEIAADGTKRHINLPEGATFFDLVNTFGLFQRGFYCLVDPPSHTASVASAEQAYAVTQVPIDMGEYRIPSISFSTANLEKHQILQAAIDTYSNEAIGQFITGQRPLSEWDSYLAELDRLGIQDWIKLHNDQQAEINLSRKK